MYCTVLYFLIPYIIRVDTLIGENHGEALIVNGWRVTRIR